MVKILRENNKNFAENFKKILIKREMIDSSVDQVVDNIIKKIKDNSDSALLTLTKKYDNFKASDINQLVVQNREIEKWHFQQVHQQMMSIHMVELNINGMV